MTLPSKREIFLAEELKNKPRIRDMAFIHEILHAAMPIDDNKRKKIMGPTIEERVITYIAPKLASVLRQLKWTR